VIPGFVVAYRNKDKKIVLYFYPGYDEQNGPIYANIDTAKIAVISKTYKNVDGSVKYIFDNDHITSITCKLVSNIDGTQYIETFNDL